MAKTRKGSYTDSKDWQGQRNALFRRNVKYAAAARFSRIACDVTQAEVAKHFNCVPTTVGAWESGKYNWQGGDAELADYQRTCRELGKGREHKVARRSAA